MNNFPGSRIDNLFWEVIQMKGKCVKNTIKKKDKN